MKQATRIQAEVADQIVEGDYGNHGFHPILNAVFADRKDPPKDAMMALKLAA